MTNPQHEALRPHEKWLRKAAEEIRSEGHTGWGNTCEQAADAIDAALEKEMLDRPVGEGVDESLIEKIKEALNNTDFEAGFEEGDEDSRNYWRARTFLNTIRKLSASPIADGVERRDVLEETGWLCELPDKSGPSWWSATEYDWTTDVSKALRFAREQDAKAHIHEIGWTDVIATEHIWYIAKAALSPTTGAQKP